MITEVTGDILLSKADLIGHGVAPMDDFHTGLALALRERWPALYKDFRHYCHTYSPAPGSVWLWSGVDASGKSAHIANLLTQEPAKGQGAHPGRATVSHLNHSLHELKKLVLKEKFKSLALPRIATGVGGLDWKDVAPLLKTTLSDLGIPVFVYTTYTKGLAADESVKGKVKK